MRERGMSTVPAVLLAGAAGLVVAVAMMDWMVIDIHTTGEDAVDLTVPVPLMVPRLAAVFIPDETLADARVPPEVRQHKELILAMVRELEAAPDTTLVRVDSPDAKVLIRTENDTLRLAVDADDATVRCAIPLSGLAKVLERWDWQTADPQLALDLLASARRGEMVKVEAEDARVSLSLW